MNRRSGLVLLLGLTTASTGRAQAPAAEIRSAAGTPLLTVNTDGGLVARGSASTGAIPATGYGARMMWYPAKSAFRAGLAVGTRWDDAEVGGYSVGFGFASLASGEYAVAFGTASSATGTATTALGYETTASGLGATALGVQTAAQGYGATALGVGTSAQGYGTVASGYRTVAKAYASVVLGRYNTVDLFGSWNPTEWESGDPLLMAGNGSATTARSNALVLLKNGNLTIAGTLTQSSDARLKEDVRPLTGALGAVLALRPVTYQFRAGTGRPSGEVQVGLVAQEVAAVLPALVRTEADGYLSVAYANLAPVLAGAVQEQQARADAQQAEIAALRTEVAALREALAAALARIERPAADERPR